MHKLARTLHLNISSRNRFYNPPYFRKEGIIKMLDIDLLNKKCIDIRKLIVNQIGGLGVGHIGGSLSVVELLVYLYYHEMNIDPKNPDMEGRDRFIMSKGHGGPALYSVLADKGYFSIEELDTLNKPGTNLPSHCDMLKTRGVDMTTGSLGQGLSCAVGMALGSKIKSDDVYIYCLLGDGEIQEGQIWEAAMAAGHFKLNRLIVFLDYNKMQISGTVEEIMDIEPVIDKWKSFNWNVYRANGHNINGIHKSVIEAKKSKDKPTMIILDTIKGKGVSFAEEAKVLSHSMTISEDMRIKAIKELDSEVDNL